MTKHYFSHLNGVVAVLDVETEVITVTVPFSAVRQYQQQDLTVATEPLTQSLMAFGILGKEYMKLVPKLP